ncbi:oxidoreductase [Actinoplanes missouriensis]|uniref:oxidoreductase n=1 Tax=Actinoplanes missouriensis TaxID=1866 RepID=UPI0033C7846F
MNLNLSGRTAVVTGASKGIGLAVAEALAAEGADVVAAARTPIPATGSVHPVAVDLTTPDGPATLVDAAVARFGGVDILVNNVGAVRPRPDGFRSVTDEDWSATFEINFFSAVRTTRAALPHLIRGGAGSIITISSVNAVLPDPLVIDYSAAKAALASFSKALSKEVGAHGVRVNTISPGPVSTDLWLGDGGVAAVLSRAAGRPPQDIAATAAKDAVTGRFTRPDEVAALVLLLAGDRAGNVTGADFAIDGGMIATL